MKQERYNNESKMFRKITGSKFQREHTAQFNFCDMKVHALKTKTEIHPSKRHLFKVRFLIFVKYQLTIVTGKSYVLLSSVQEFIEIEAWLLLTFFLCLHNQSSSIHSTVTNEKVQMFEKGDSSNRQKTKAAPFGMFYFKIWVGFCLNTGKRFFLEASIYNQQKLLQFFQKTVQRIFKIALCLRDRNVFMWQSLEILNIFNTLNLNQIFWKMKTFLKKLDNWFLVESIKVENAINGMEKGKWNREIRNGLIPKKEVFASNYFYLFQKFDSF